MKTYEVIGYAYEADIHCPECARKRFGNPDNATDSEGNPVHPIFAGDEGAQEDFCSDCHKELMD